MRKAFRVAGTVLSVAAITPFLDGIVTARLLPGARGVRFVDGFAPFFKEPADSALRRNYIEGDVHFTAAGNRLIYETVRQTVDGRW